MNSSLHSLRLFVTAALLAAVPSFSLEPAARSGGDTTVQDTSRHAFGRSLANLRRERWPLLRSGKELFVREWAAPLLGPLHNAVSCADCHFLDGRGGPRGEAPVLLRLSPPDPSYGVQIQDRAVAGARPEANVSLHWQTVKGRYPDGLPYRLRRPRWTLTRLALGSLHRATRLSPRIPPSLVGLGLLEAVPTAALLEHADPDDTDGDGIAGRLPAGRFGWRGSEASLEGQIQRAMEQDLGLGELTGPESGDELRRLAAYVRLLAVPARRGVDRPEVRRGEALFQRIGCASCHLPELRTDPAAAIPELGGQTIHPYTDLLLHNLGPDLADLRRNGRADSAPSSRAWRTAPLWGLGLLGTVTQEGKLHLLHDGRARNAEEAVLWHGGEARRARDRFRALPAADRAALASFLESL